RDCWESIVTLRHTSLLQDYNFLSGRSCSLAILPTTLDTPMNRKWMPKADFSSWTPLTYISELLHEWTVNASSRPASGSLVKLITRDGHSSTSIC
uniref:Uncharacterized protein n=1 Tax=Parascaris equorum TaxID=6256 RepID=A0A914RDZ8_PAREQ